MCATHLGVRQHLGVVDHGASGRGGTSGRGGGAAVATVASGRGGAAVTRRFRRRAFARYAEHEDLSAKYYRRAPPGALNRAGTAWMT